MKLDRKIPFLKPPFTNDDIEAAVRVMKTANVSKGDEVNEFEKRFAEYIGCEHAVTVNSGTSALELSLEALTLLGYLEIESTVALPSFTYVGVANAIVTAGMQPKFIDIDPVTLCADKLTCYNADAVIFVHTYGHPVSEGVLRLVNESIGTTVIEDCSEACGARIDNRCVGSYGIISTFSFNATKNMTTGEGGAITTNNTELYNLLITLREQGFDGDGKFVFPGHNVRMSNIVAAIGLSQLDRLFDMNAKRLELARKYNDLLKDAVTVPDLPDGHSVQLYTIRVPEDKREHVINYLKACGVEAKVYFKPIHQFEFYQRYFLIEPLKVTEQVAKEVLSLPMYPSLTDDEIEYVANAVKVSLK